MSARERTLDSCYMRCLKTAPTILIPKSVMRHDRMSTLRRDSILLRKNADC